MSDVAKKNQRFGGFAFLCVAAALFATGMFVLAAPFAVLGIVFLAKSHKKDR